MLTWIVLPASGIDLQPQTRYDVLYKVLFILSTLAQARPTY